MPSRASRAKPTPSPFQVVFVCTGNRARSAVAEALFRRRVRGLPVSVCSLGTLDVGSAAALPQAARAASMLGVDIAAHRARPLRAGILVESDLVIGFEPSHVSAAVVDGGARRERVFSIIELARTLDEIRATTSSNASSDPERMVELAHRRRGQGFLSAPSVPDPLGASEDVFRRMVVEIDQLLHSIALGLFGGDR